MDAGRKMLAEMIGKRPKTSLRSVSLEMGHNAAYLHQFLNKESPLYLDERDREFLVRFLRLSNAQADLLRPPAKEALTIATETGDIEVASSGRNHQEMNDKITQICLAIDDVPTERLNEIERHIQYIKARRDQEGSRPRPQWAG